MNSLISSIKEIGGVVNIRPYSAGNNPSRKLVVEFSGLAVEVKTQKQFRFVIHCEGRPQEIPWNENATTVIGIGEIATPNFSVISFEEYLELFRKTYAWLGFQRTIVRSKDDLIDGEVYTVKQKNSGLVFSFRFMDIENSGLGLGLVDCYSSNNPYEEMDFCGAFSEYCVCTVATKKEKKALKKEELANDFKWERHGKRQA